MSPRLSQLPSRVSAFIAIQNPNAALIFRFFIPLEILGLLNTWVISLDSESFLNLDKILDHRLVNEKTLVSMTNLMNLPEITQTINSVTD